MASGLKASLVGHKEPPPKWTLREQLILASSVQRSGDQNWASVSRAIKPLMDESRPPDYYSQKNCAIQYAAMLDKASTPKRKRKEDGAPDIVETVEEQIVRHLTSKRIKELDKMLSKTKEEYLALKKEVEQLEKGELDDQLQTLWDQIQAEKDGTYKKVPKVTTSSELNTKPVSAPVKSDPVPVATYSSEQPLPPLTPVTTSEKSPTVVASAVTVSSTVAPMVASTESSTSAISSAISSTVASTAASTAASTVASTVASTAASTAASTVASTAASAVASVVSSTIASTVTSTVTSITASDTEPMDHINDTKPISTTTITSSITSPITSSPETSSSQIIASVTLPAAASQTIAAADSEQTTPTAPPTSTDVATNESTSEEKMETENEQEQLVVVKEEAPEITSTNEITPSAEEETTSKEDNNLELPKEIEKEKENNDQCESKPAISEDTNSNTSNKLEVKDEPVCVQQEDQEEDIEVDVESTQDDISKEQLIEAVATSPANVGLKRGDTLSRKHDSFVEQTETPPPKVSKTQEIKSEEKIEETVRGRKPGKTPGRKRSGRGRPPKVEVHCNTPPFECESEEDNLSALSSAVPSPSQGELDSEVYHSLRSWRKTIMLVWRHAAQHKYANLFLHPVREEDAPGYYEVVLRPMDLTTIKKNIETGVIKTDIEFQRDMLLMFQNAFMYNNSDHDVYKMAEEMRIDVMENIQEYLLTQMMVHSSNSKTLRSRENKGIEDKLKKIEDPSPVRKRRPRLED